MALSKTRPGLTRDPTPQNYTAKNSKASMRIANKITGKIMTNE